MDIIVWEGIGILAGAVCLFFAVKCATLTQAQLAQVSDRLWERYKGDDQPQNLDRAVAYVHREADRQINKVRGILAFDAIFFVAARTYADQPGDVSKAFDRAALSYLLISIAVSLILFVVKWGDVSVYRDFNSEFLFAFEVVRKRTLWVNYAAMLSLLSAIALLALLILHALP
jgi:hypothetical protein